MATYTSSIQRLREMPGVFSGRDLTVRFQWSAATASQYLANWKRAELVRPLGGHSDVFMNLVVAPQPDLEAALLRALPEAIKVGVDVLREAGWTTQVQRMPDVAVKADSPRYKLLDFTLQPRSAGWFERVKPGLVESSSGIRRLAPAWALADMLDRWLDRRVKGAWLLAPDDLELDGVPESDGASEALAAFGLPDGAFESHGYAEIYDSRAS